MKSLAAFGAFLFALSLSLPADAQTQAWPHRALPEEAKGEIQKQRRDLTDYSIREIELLGVRGTLTPQQWKEFRRRSIPETDIIRVYDSCGITPEMSDSLKSIGVDFEDAEKRWTWGPGHYAAMVDVVLLGRVQKIEYHLEGPYHTWVRVLPEKFLKGTAEREVVVKILNSGPTRGLNDEILITESDAEPKFRLGERVLLFLRKWPRDLLYVQRVKRNLTPAAHAKHFTRQYGTAEMAEAELAAGGYYELGADAFRVVGNQAVSKSRALRVPNPNGDRFNLRAAQELTQRVVEVQAKFERRR